MSFPLNILYDNPHILKKSTDTEITRIGWGNVDQPVTTNGQELYKS